MALNSRRHDVPAGTDQSVSRGTIFETFGNSIHDIVPVTNGTDAAQLISELTAAGQAPSETNPTTVYQADDPGLHRMKWTPDGTTWLPLSGVLRFTDAAAADAWATANGALLTVGDVAIIAGRRIRWNGTAWQHTIGTQYRRTSSYNFGTTSVLIPWNAADFQSGDVVNSAGDISFKTPGEYQVSFLVTAGVNAATRVYAQLQLNGSDIAVAEGTTTQQARTSLSATVGVLAAVGDTLRLRAGATINTVAADVNQSRNYISIVPVG